MSLFGCKHGILIQIVKATQGNCCFIPVCEQDYATHAVNFCNRLLLLINYLLNFLYTFAHNKLVSSNSRNKVGCCFALPHCFQCFFAVQKN